MENGQRHLYYGDGKGKTTAAMGLALRCAGQGFGVFIFQFLKEPTSGELTVLRTLKGVTIEENGKKEKFVFQMDDAEKQQLKEDETKRLRNCFLKCSSGCYDMIVLDEALTAYQLDVVDREFLFEFLEAIPKTTEIVITGHGYHERFFAFSDYITHMEKKKHPYDKGVGSRIGIEK